MKVESLPATKILASVRSREHSPDFFEEIIKSGATLFRYNFSFVDLENDAVGRGIEAVRRVANNLDIVVGIIADIPGPALKTATPSAEDIYLKKGEDIVFCGNKVGELSIKHECKNLYGQLEGALIKGDLQILIDHAHAVLSVKSVDAKRKRIEAVAINDSFIKNNKNISFPGCYLELEPIPQKDRERLEYIAKKDFDFVFQSYVQCKEDIRQMRSWLEANNANDKLVVVKVETGYAVKNLNEIVQESDGVIVARGHLADELSERLMLPIYQREIIRAAKRYSKPAIVATELYYSMVDSYYPNRPDMENIFSAAADKVDVLFLSGETTNSKEPCRLVQTLRKQLKLTEGYLGTGQIQRPDVPGIKAVRKAILKRGVYPIGIGK